jgi:CRP-like cAMP-binding protein
MTIEDDIAFFERVPTLNLLGRDALRILAIGAENRYVHSGEALFIAGEAADGAYVVQEGSFSLTAPHDEAFKVGPMTLLGELAMIAETKRAMTATALEPSSVLRIPRSLFLKMLESFPQTAWRLREVLSKRSERSLDEMFMVRDALKAQMPELPQYEPAAGYEPAEPGQTIEVHDPAEPAEPTEMPEPVDADEPAENPPVEEPDAPDESAR